MSESSRCGVELPVSRGLYFLCGSCRTGSRVTARRGRRVVLHLYLIQVSSLTPQEVMWIKEPGRV
jgi:hypothetical protein